MILATKKDGRVILCRCECSHSWEVAEIEDNFILESEINSDKMCPKCGYFPWRVKGLDDDELKRPD